MRRSQAKMLLPDLLLQLWRHLLQPLLRHTLPEVRVQWPSLRRRHHALKVPAPMSTSPSTCKHLFSVLCKYYGVKFIAFLFYLLFFRVKFILLIYFVEWNRRLMWTRITWQMKKTSWGWYQLLILSSNCVLVFITDLYRSELLFGNNQGSTSVTSAKNDFFRTPPSGSRSVGDALSASKSPSSATSFYGRSGWIRNQSQIRDSPKPWVLHVIPCIYSVSYHDLSTLFKATKFKVNASRSLVWRQSENSKYDSFECQQQHQLHNDVKIQPTNTCQRWIPLHP